MPAQPRLSASLLHPTPAAPARRRLKAVATGTGRGLPAFALSLALSLGVSLGLGALAPEVMAQTLKDPSVDDQIRTIPDEARLGRLRMGVFPEAAINGKAVRFSPAARILDRNNVAIVPGMVTDTVWVRYRTEPTGLVQTTWILTDDELASARRRR